MCWGLESDAAEIERMKTTEPREWGSQSRESEGDRSPGSQLDASSERRESCHCCCVVRENGADIKLVCTREREKNVAVWWGRKEGDGRERWEERCCRICCVRVWRCCLHVWMALYTCKLCSEFCENIIFHASYVVSREFWQSRTSTVVNLALNIFIWCDCRCLTCLILPTIHRPFSPVVIDLYPYTHVHIVACFNQPHSWGCERLLWQRIVFWQFDFEFWDRLVVVARRFMTPDQLET